MDIAVAVKERRSIRKFKPNPVPRELISEIIEKARLVAVMGKYSVPGAVCGLR